LKILSTVGIGKPMATNCAPHEDHFETLGIVVPDALLFFCAPYSAGTYMGIEWELGMYSQP